MSAEWPADMAGRARALIAQADALDRTLSIHAANITLAKHRTTTLLDDARDVASRLTDLEEKVNAGVHDMTSLRTAIKILLDDLDEKERRKKK